MANDVFSVALHCKSCAATGSTARKREKYLKLFPAAEPTAFLAIDLLRPLPRSKREQQCVLVITDRRISLFRSVLLRTTTVIDVASTFLDPQVYNYKAPVHVLTDNERQFSAKLSDAVCVLLRVKHAPTTACHPQKNGHIERFEKAIAQLLHHDLEDNQRDLYIYLHYLMSAHSFQVFRSAETALFDLAFTRLPSELLMTEATSQGTDTAAEETVRPL